jgi:hypothetical protein
MIEGRMKKFLAEVTLLNQQFVVNPDLTVAAAAKEAGVEITGFVRLEVGEGIEKVEKEDFAAEVAKAAQGLTPGQERARSAGRHGRGAGRSCPAFSVYGSARKRRTAPPRDMAVPFSTFTRASLGTAHVSVSEGDTTGEIARGGAPPTREPGCGCRDATMAPLDPMFLAVNCHHSRNGFTLRCALGIR